MAEKIALGFGNNIDYEIVWKSDVITALIAAYGIHAAELDMDRAIHSERDLVISILAFMRAESGGERFIGAPDVVDQFADRFEKKITLGGTSVRAAIAMRKFGYTSALHLATINDDVRRLIPQDSPYVCSNSKESAFPHLIVQYGKGTHIQANDIDIRTQHANRLIYHCDEDNIVMALNEAYADLIREAKVLLISGFNAMHDEALLRDRLTTLKRILRALPKDALVFYEDAGFYNPRFSHRIIDTLGSQIDVYSLNEDELQGYLGRKLDLLDVTQIRAALEALHKLIPVPVLVVHSKYWAVAYGENAPSFAKALKAGITMASTRYGYGDDMTPEQYDAVAALPANLDSVAFAAAFNALPDGRFTCVPVPYIHTANATTIGLGDAFVGGFLPALLER